MNFRSLFLFSAFALSCSADTFTYSGEKTAGEEFVATGIGYINFATNCPNVTLANVTSFDFLLTLTQTNTFPNLSVIDYSQLTALDMTVDKNGTVSFFSMNAIVKDSDGVGLDAFTVTDFFGITIGSLVGDVTFVNPGDPYSSADAPEPVLLASIGLGLIGLKIFAGKRKGSPLTQPWKSLTKGSFSVESVQKLN